MSAVKILGNSSGTGTFTIGSPNSNSDRVLTLPDNTGTILASQLPGISQIPPGSIIKASYFSNNTRTALSNSANAVLWSITPIVKSYSSTQTDLVVYGVLVGMGSFSYSMGLYAHIAGSTTLTTDGTAYYDIHHATPPSGATVPSLIIISGKRFENLNSGNITLDIGWSVKNADAGNKPFIIWNPNSTDDARAHQLRSNIVVYEVLR